MIVVAMRFFYVSIPIDFVRNVFESHCKGSNIHRTV